MTRSGRRAQGIAQFMPGTAAELACSTRSIRCAALPKSAEFLEELHAQFGNLGLAAAACCRGSGAGARLALAGRGGLPAETRNYTSSPSRAAAPTNWAANRGADLAPPATPRAAS